MDTAGFFSLSWGAKVVTETGADAEEERERGADGVASDEEGVDGLSD